MSDATWATALHLYRLMRRASVAGLTAMLVACGGGNASDPAENTVILPGGIISTPGGTGGTGDTGDTGADTQADKGTVALVVIDPGTSQSTNTLAFGTSSTLRATVRDALGRAVPGVVVSFTSTGGASLQFSPAGTALTDASGVATIAVQPASAAVAGAFTITASRTVDEQLVRGTVDVAVGAPPVTLGVLSVAQSPLAAFGSTVVSVPIAGVPATTPIAVRFTSACAQLSPAKATVTSLVTSSGGVARATYTDLGCGSTDLITATVEATSITSTGTISVTPPVNTIALSVVDQSTGQPTNAISLLKQTQVRATVLNAAGAPVPNAVVRFDADSEGAIAFDPAPTALTNASGVASVTIRPATFTTAGAYTITAFTQVDQAIARGTINIAVGATDVTLGAVDFGQSPLSAYGTTVVSVPIGGVPAGTPVAIRFASTCAAQNPARAEITALVATTTGVARATYVDRGCAGDDLVSATVEGTSVVSVATLQVAQPAVSNLRFVSATPSSIAIQGTGGIGLSEVSLVRFRLVDQANNPVATPTNVSLSLSTNTGGILIDQVAGPIVRQTDANGEVEVQIRSGVLPTPVWVIASVDLGGGQVLSTNSNVLTVSTDQPTQNRFSLSFERLNIEGWQYDNEQSTTTILAADNFGNPVADGTAINFISEGASVGDACTTVNGACSVIFRSQENRPVAAPGKPRSDSGRVSVLAYAVGEEAYEDFNSNNAYDFGEVFHDLGYVYVDADENGQFDAGERFIPFNSQSAACVNPSPATFDTPSRPGTCNGAWGQAHARRQGGVVLSGSFAFFKSSPIDPFVGVPPADVGTIYQFGASCVVQVPFWLQDVNGNPMPVNTAVTANVTAGKDLAASVAGDVVRNTTARGGTFHVLNVSGFNEDSGQCSGSGTVVVDVTTPRGNVTSLTVSILPQPSP